MTADGLPAKSAEVVADCLVAKSTEMMAVKSKETTAPV